MPKSSITSDSQKNEWKYEAPAHGASIEKTLNGKTFWWCNGSNGKNNKPMFCRHKPTDCKEIKDVKETTSSVEIMSTQQTKETTPTLKLNNNLATEAATVSIRSRSPWRLVLYTSTLHL